MSKWVFGFGAGTDEGRADMRDLLGGKGANLAEMSRIGLPVPPGFTLSTELCVAFHREGRRYPQAVRDQVRTALGRLEAALDLRFGDPDRPLLLSVRSGARVSMPGMMDTVLNLGLNDRTVGGLARMTGDARFAWDSYRRFLQIHGTVVLGVGAHRFEEAIEQVRLDTGLTDTDAFGGPEWQRVARAHARLIETDTGASPPQDTEDQLWSAIDAVFASWMNARAKTYRRLHDIPDEWGTAVTVQAMVFGNLGPDCATGVCFTRDPSTGENVCYGEYLPNAQGEDVVAGTRTPHPLTRRDERSDASPMQDAMPDAFAALLGLRARLERHFRDMQDIEFTIERGRLYLLQTRAGKRSAAAGLRIAVEMASSGLIGRSEAVRRVPAATLDHLLHPALDPDAPRTPLARGLPASPGAASGAIVLSADEAQVRAGRGEAVILVRSETSPDDIHGMSAARGVLTTRGGMTSHAAVVARGIGRPCVSGAATVTIDVREGRVIAGGRTLAVGDVVTLDGSTGEIFLGAVPTVDPPPSADFTTVMGWADAVRRLRVRANADTPEEAALAQRFGADGIGLCRTERMFADPARLLAMRRLIVAGDEAARREAIAALLAMLRAEFCALFRVGPGRPVAVRLIDPPLVQFLPHTGDEIAALAHELGIDEAEMLRRRRDLEETNPMLGHRGCRLAITTPDLCALQARAILQAARTVSDETGRAIAPDFLVPLVAAPRELERVRHAIDTVAHDLATGGQPSVAYRVGAMIELPRAALLAGEIAARADFLTLGTDDLTQTVFGVARADSDRFLTSYLGLGILAHDPFVTLDREAVGPLLEAAVDKARAARPDLEIGTCGEHAADPASIAFFDRLGLDHISCAPFRVPLARLAAAHATIGGTSEA